MNDWHERIETNPAVLDGKPVVRGTRLAVEFIIELQHGCLELNCEVKHGCLL